jgi:hypothetical protein
MEIEQPKSKKPISEKLQKILFPYKYPKKVSIQFFEQKATPGTQPYAEIKISKKEAGRFPFFQTAMRFPTHKGKIIISHDFMQSNAVAFNVQLADVIKRLSIQDFELMKEGFDQRFYTVPPVIDSTFPAEMDVRFFHEAAIDADALGRSDFTTLILANYAKRIIANPIPAEIPKEPLQFGYDHDKTIAKVIINTALMQKAQYNLKDMFYSLPLGKITNYLNYSNYSLHHLTVSNNEDVYLVPTCTAEHCLAVYTGGVGQARFGKLIFEKNMYFRYEQDISKTTNGTILSSDVSRNMKYLTMLCVDRDDDPLLMICTINNKQEIYMKIKDVLKFDKSLMPKEGQPVRVMFQKNSHIFYVKLGNVIYECNADDDALQLNNSPYATSAKVI